MTRKTQGTFAQKPPAQGSALGEAELQKLPAPTMAWELPWYHNSALSVTRGGRAHLGPDYTIGTRLGPDFGPE